MTVEFTPAVPMGWQCPLCGAVYAPTVATCWNHHSNATITTTNTKPEAKP